MLCIISRSKTNYYTLLCQPNIKIFLPSLFIPLCLLWDGYVTIQALIVNVLLTLLWKNGEVLNDISPNDAGPVKLSVKISTSRY